MVAPHFGDARSFYNPALTPEEAQVLDWANFLVVLTVQAFLGSISDNFEAIAIDVRPEAGTIHVALRQPATEDEEEIHEAVADIELWLDGRVALTHSVTFGRPNVSEWAQSGRRLVFLRRGPRPVQSDDSAHA